MAKYKSLAGKPETAAEGRLKAVKFLLVWVSVVAIVAVGIWWMFYKAPWNQPEEQQTTASECGPVLDRSVFTTGNPVLDQRILWAIVNDDSENHAAAEALVTHIWDEGNFNFQDPEATALWAEATSAVITVDGSIEKPALMVTSDGAIIPFTDVAETQDIQWTEVNVTSPLAQKTTFIMSAQAGETQSASVPTVLLSINGATLVPSPTLGTASEHVAVGTKEVCEQ